jgi:predicted RecA/RadA family phage recombinase
MEATFVSGCPVMVDYTPGSAVEVGDIVVAGNGVRIAHADIAASALGAMAAGGGVYDIVKSADYGYTDGDDVFWDASGTPVGGTATGAATFNDTGVWIGKAVASCTAAATTVRVLHGITPTTDQVS